ncbi:hypothetical protein, partial [Salmonella sp. s51228]|uniref:hypothetical protein n=1 Tax=Salmonella sp. s51228 TaxID=3159652 RepID=UPI0039813D15
LGELKKHFEDMKINVSMISQGVALIYSFFLNPEKAAERFALPVSAVVEKVIKEPIPLHQSSIVLEMCCEDMEGNDIEVPYIKYDFR